MSDEHKRRWEKGLKKPVQQKTTWSGLEVSPLATPEDIKSGYDESLGNPGEYPFTRGVYNTMYLGRPWTFRQYSGFGTPEDTNKRYKFLLEQGQTGLSVAFDLPSQVGLDSDHPMAVHEAGRVGVSIDSLKDMEIVFEGIDLGKISTSFTINSTAPIMLAMYAAVGEKQGVPLDQLRGTIQNDLLKEYVARGTWIFPPRPALRLIADTIIFCAKDMPKFNPISIAGAHFRDAGATAMQEIAFALADAIAYVEEVLKRGMDIDDFAPQLSFFFYTYMDIFEEAAKYRAARRMWARIVKERFGAKKAKSMMFRFGVACGGASLAANEPLNNVVRVSYAALGAALGGTQSNFTCAYDEAYALPTEESARLALRTQQILAEEAGMCSSVDPLAGSYFVENLTDKMEDEALGIMSKIEELGGMVPCIEKGIIQKWVADEAYKAELAIHEGRKTWVGVNKYKSDNSRPEMQLHKHNTDAVDKQIEKLGLLRSERDQAAVDKALADLKAAALGQDNLMQPIMEAVRVYATVGEITATMKDIFGEFKEPVFV